ncbi:NACHT, LRR and PYD domains-containing protein 12-like [Sinocyclocheilus grahami]|uniref:NACHT, LRR and PYD domains-containing protein 12-like n=1 Tax=Sinocyclocheilus grahami TaxID=75366 RepID=UPI0007AD543E|nr:PREDICTED: NACHT, LRR and PYD domains-containing protein 12-like [Sinocyclocheilus grahami]
MKTDASMDCPFKFSSGDPSADVSNKQDGSVSSIGKKQLGSIFKKLEDTVISLLKKELMRFKALLSSDYSMSSEIEEEHQVREGFLKITLHALRKMNQTDLAKTLQTKLAPLYVKKHKSRLKDTFQRINEGISKQGNSLLNEIYTELYITEGGSGEVNTEHEVRQIERTSRRPEMPIKCNDIFKTLPAQDKPIRTVLTKGVAGIGKTVSVQKFILDWAEGKENQDIHFMFPLPFRELNLMKEKNMSLMGLLYQFVTGTEELRSKDIHDYEVLFIFDGLDECRLPLNFRNNQRLCDVTEAASVDVLLTNLIMGNLLPSALLWITTRPAAASQIPPECVDQITEVRGFNDPQKDEYFRKKIHNESLANKIITHIKSSRSLHIMCHIPVFCWITATVLEAMLLESESGKIPNTLTQMFTRFLIFQTKLKTQKYEGKCDVDLQQTKKNLLLLGKLAFEQLEKGNLIFYEEDLRECGIDVREASVYSGVCTQIFREEFGLHLGKVFSFMHLSIQEFLAAVYVFVSFVNKNIFTSKSKMLEFLKSEVDRALQSANGHLDLFLRFLLGLSLESNQAVFRSLLKQRGSSFHSGQGIVKYIKMKIRENPSSEKSINLFYCLNELNDHSLEQEVQIFLKRGRSDISNLSPAQWSALVFMLLNSEKELNEFKLSEYYPSEECLLRLLPVVTASRIADLSKCHLKDESCSALAKVLSSYSSSLRELNLSNNNLQDCGVRMLSAGLGSSTCHLETLKLSNCCIRDEGCAALATALKSNPSHLRELNLSYNYPGDSVVKQLCGVLEDPQCKLKKLQLEHCCIRDEGCAALATALRSNPSHLRELNLSTNTLRDSGAKLLSALLEDPQCKLEKLQLSHCSIGEEGCALLVLALKSNPLHLEELNLSFNKPGDSGVTLLSAVLMDPQCKLERLQLSTCDIREKGCAALASALKSNPSHLRELNLNFNKLEDSGVKLLCAGLVDQHCKLEKLWLSWCRIGEEDCPALASALKSNLSSLIELNLNNTAPGDTEVELLSALLIDPHCKLEKLQLSRCCIRNEGFAALISALKSNPSHLRELNVNENDLEDSEVRLLSDLLKDPRFKLAKLQLSHCRIRYEGFAALISALKSNPSHLRELELNENDPGVSEVRLLSGLLRDPRFKLAKLQLSNCFIPDEGCAALATALKSNPSHLRELNLSYNYPGDSVVKQLCGVLEDPQCKLKKLQLEHCCIRDEGCAALATALRSNPSHLRELNLSTNTLRDSGAKLLSALLEDPQCKLEKLQLSNCHIRDEGCAALASALKSNPSHLRELNLNNNELGGLGLKLLNDIQEDPQYKLEELHICPVL